ncbi:ICE-like protease (caspase) p20 domain protein [Ceratobasidium sp. AG-Ba]|nr:ICE-like protease (caspase) p20 domain protein [Ceratobasidium sp. AG-Ba]
MGRIIFTSKTSRAGDELHRVRLEENNKPALAVGALAGVTNGSIWELYDSPTENANCIGRFRACKPECMRTELQAISGPWCTQGEEEACLVHPGAPYARQIGTGEEAKLHAYFSPEAQDLICSRHNLTTAAMANFGWIEVEERTDADILVEFEDLESPQEIETAPKRQVRLTLCNAVAEKYHVAKLCHQIEAQKQMVEDVLSHAARWNWHLRRSSLRQEKSGVTVEFVRFTTCSSGLNVPSKNLIQEGVVDLKVQEEDQYGIRIINDCSTPFYIRCFYFCADDFSIFDLTPLCASNKCADPELSAQGIFTIGDGANGGSVLTFQIEPNKQLELGFIRVFWSSDPLEMSDVQQDSAFKFGARAPVLRNVEDSRRKELGPGVPDTDILAKRTSVVTTNESLSRLYALVIGINSYPKLKPLAGAVADAAAIEHFLTVDLHVPSDHIQKLIDGHATRDKIILAFRQLRDDPRIQKGDPILIYFAGHGGLGKASHEWSRRYGYDDIQVIFPYDYGLPVAGCQQIVNCIPDQTIAVLLNDLASVKGNNVTVIFDSCHSASANRGENLDNAVPGRIARDPEVQVNIPDNIDADIISLSPIKPPESSYSAAELSRHALLPLYSDQASHVYFAACGSQEKAWEEDGKGVFTSALLRCIRANGVDKISYSDLLMSMPLLPKQSPHCYGLHKTRTLFDSRVPSRKVTFIPIKIERGALILQAGAASGVTQGSVWELHPKPMEDSKTLGRLSAQTPQVASALLIPLAGEHVLDLAKIGEPMTDRLYARQIRSGTGQELRIYFSPEARRRIFTSENDNRSTELNRMRNHEIGYVVHSARDSADLVVEISNVSSGQPEVTYTLCDAHAQKYGVAQLRKRTRAQRDEVERILFAAARCIHDFTRNG